MRGFPFDLKNVAIAFQKTKSLCFRLAILDLHVGHVGGEAQKNILSILLWAPASVGENIIWFDPRDWLQVKISCVDSIQKILLVMQLHEFTLKEVFMT